MNMGEDQKYYDVEDYKRWKRSQGKVNKVAPRPNLLAAASWLRRFFDARKTNWAALGSLAMLCLGARREFPDIHVVYDDKDFQRIRMKLQSDPRVRLPKDMNPMFSSKLLVSTGPKYKDAGCTENADIEVEMIPPGSHGTPPSDILRKNQAMLSLNLDGKLVNIKGLNITYLIQTTVHLCNSKDLLWDPKKDLLWLCRQYSKEIHSIRGHLNTRQVQEDFLGTQYFSTLSRDEQRMCYHVLLGKDPPPSMLITPAPKFTSVSARPTIPSHNSAPSHIDGMQRQQKQETALLRPPMPHKAKTTPGASTNQSVKLATPHTTPSPLLKDATSGSARDPHSRYHNSSAPTTPNGNRIANPETAAVRSTRTVVKNDSNHMQQHSIFYQAQSINMLAPSSKPQVVRTKKSLPRVNDPATSAQAVPIFAHKPNTISTASKGNAQLVTAATPRQSGPEVGPQILNKEAQADSSVLPSSAPDAQPQVVAHTHPAHKIIARHSMMSTIIDRAAPGPPHPTSVRDFKSELPSKDPIILDRESFYSTTPSAKPIAQPVNGQQAAPIIQDQVKNSFSGFVFELDATSPQVENFSAVAQVKELIAELPGDSTALLQPVKPLVRQTNSLPETPISPPLPQRRAHLASTPEYEDSPVSPPTTYRPLDLRLSSSNPELTVKPPMLPAPAAKAMPAPPSFEPLPPSLMIGFRRPQQQQQQHPPANMTSRVRASSQLSCSSNPPAALDINQRYYSPPVSRDPSPNTGSTSAPNSRQSSPRRGPVYKAYTPPVTPPMQPKMDLAHAQQPATMQHQALTPSETAPGSVRSAFVPKERAPGVIERASPPDMLRAGVNVQQPFKTAKAFYHSNPPTLHSKHDSHQEPQRDNAPYNAPVAVPTAVTQKQQQMAHFSPKHASPPTKQTQYIAFSAQHASLPESHQSTGHQRTVSAESNTSTTSHDSEKLALEYQLDLPSFEDGYGAKKTEVDAQLKKSYRPSYAGNGYGEQCKLDFPDCGKRESKGGFMGGYDFK